MGRRVWFTTDPRHCRVPNEALSMQSWRLFLCCLCELSHKHWP